MNEPIFKNNPAAVSLPQEPRLDAKEEKPTELSVVPGQEKSGASFLTEKNRKVFESLSKELEDISKPFEPQEAKVAEVPTKEKEITQPSIPIVSTVESTPAREVPTQEKEPVQPLEPAVVSQQPAQITEPSTPEEPPEIPDELGDPEPAETTHGFLRFIMLLICLLMLMAATWQICLFLQPEFMRSSPAKEFSEQSCKFFYCPPAREMRILNTHLQNIGPNEWNVSFQLQNLDMREQKLPQFLLTVMDGKNVAIRTVFDFSQYKTNPSVTAMRGGDVVTVTIPFRYEAGRPTEFKLQAINEEQ